MKKDVEMFRIVEELERTGISAREICKKYSLTKDSLFYWRKKYQRTSINKEKKSFIPVTITDNHKTEGLKIRLIYPNAVSLELENISSIELVRQLIKLY